MKRSISFLSVMVLVGSSGAFAQNAPANVEEKRKTEPLKEIEHGFFFEGRGGFTAVINPIARGTSASYVSPGQALGVDFGIDIGDYVSPSIFFIATSNRMGSDYTGINTTGTASGDFSTLTPGAALKVRLVGFNDSQDVKRTWIYVRAGAGAMFYMPTTLLPQLDVLVTAGPGVEYFTRLRHLSIGLEASFNFMALSQSFGFNTLLTVKYAFGAP